MKKIAVCVTGQKTCERLISYGAMLASSQAAELLVVHVAPRGADFLDNRNEGEALDYLYRVSQAAQADMTVLRADDVFDTLRDYAIKHKITHFVIGATDEAEHNHFYQKLSARVPSVQIVMC